MTPHTISQTVLPDLFEKPVVAAFKREQASSDGGAVLRKAGEWVYGFGKAFARCLADRRAAGKIRHALYGSARPMDLLRRSPRPASAALDTALGGVATHRTRARRDRLIALWRAGPFLPGCSRGASTARDQRRLRRRPLVSAIGGRPTPTRDFARAEPARDLFSTASTRAARLNVGPHD